MLIYSNFIDYFICKWINWMSAKKHLVLTEMYGGPEGQNTSNFSCCCFLKCCYVLSLRSHRRIWSFFLCTLKSCLRNELNKGIVHVVIKWGLQRQMISVHAFASDEKLLFYQTAITLFKNTPLPRLSSSVCVTVWLWCLKRVGLDSPKSHNNKKKLKSSLIQRICYEACLY